MYKIKIKPSLDLPYIVFGKPSISKKSIKSVCDSLNAGWLGTGPKVERFKNNFLKYTGAMYGAPLHSCTAGLFLGLKSLNLKTTTTVVTSATTFCATVNSIINSDLKPLLVDIDPNTLNLNHNLLPDVVDKNTKVIMPVHFAGRPCNLDFIDSFCKTNNFILFHDCAHAIETRYRNKHISAFGDLSAYSFYSTKNLAMGEGGMLLSNNPEYIKKISSFALHGLSKDAWKRFSDNGYKHYDVINAGFKFNMMDLQAAIGLDQLCKLEKNYLRRKQIWETYNYYLSDLPIRLPTRVEKHERHAFHLYTIILENNEKREAFLTYMHKNSIGTGVHYRSIAAYEFYLNKLRINKKKYPVSIDFGERCVSLPLSPGLSKTEISKIIYFTREFFSAN